LSYDNALIIELVIYGVMVPPFIHYHQLTDTPQK